jgi:hypothetical protein
MQTFKLLLTWTGVIAPNVLIMNAMGWTSAVHFVVIGMWALISTPLVVLVSKRHRRPEWHRRRVLGTLVGSVAVGSVVLGTDWDVRAVIAALLVLPGLAYLLLEAAGLTPDPVTSGSLP